MTYRLTPKAEADLAAIGDYIAADNPRAAARFLDTIETQCRRLGANPNLGPRRPEIAPDMHLWPVGKYLILYRVATGGIEVVRVAHGARDLERIAF